MTLTPQPYPVTAADVLLAAVGLTVALALAWISLDLCAGGRLTVGLARLISPPAGEASLRVVPAPRQPATAEDTGT